MEKSGLPPDLRTIVDQFTKFRKEYSTLKTLDAAQEEVIKLQKMELEKMNLRTEQLASALMDYQRRFNSTLHHLQSENKSLQKVIENARRECENSRDCENNLVREVQRNDEEYIHRLEIDLEELRTEIASQDEKHREQIKSIEDRHRNEISFYEEKLERVMSLERRHRDEIDAYKKKLEQLDAMERRCDVLITQQEKNCVDDALRPSMAKNKYSQYSHPAFDNNTGNAASKRKKSAPASYRWPQLDISVKKESENTQMSTQKKRKKLYILDDEAIIDLTS